jgi:hypothetical protein
MSRLHLVKKLLALNPFSDVICPRLAVVDQICTELVQTYNVAM